MNTLPNVETEIPPRRAPMSPAELERLREAARRPIGKRALAAYQRERELAAAALGHHVAYIVDGTRVHGAQLPDEVATQAIREIIAAAKVYLSAGHDEPTPDAGAGETPANSTPPESAPKRGPVNTGRRRAKAHHCPWCPPRQTCSHWTPSPAAAQIIDQAKGLRLV